MRGQGHGGGVVEAAHTCQQPVVQEVLSVRHVIFAECGLVEDARTESTVKDTYRASMVVNGTSISTVNTVGIACCVAAIDS